MLTNAGPFLPPGSSMSQPNKPPWSPCIPLPPSTAPTLAGLGYSRLVVYMIWRILSSLPTYFSHSDLLGNHLSSWDHLPLSKPLTTSLASSIYLLVRSCFPQNILSYSYSWLVICPTTPQWSPPSYLASCVYMMPTSPMRLETLAGACPLYPGWTEKSMTS